jgi:hypothetical protein
MFNTVVGAGAGAASRYGSGSDQMMRFLAAPAPDPEEFCHGGGSYFLTRLDPDLDLNYFFG